MAVVGAQGPAVWHTSAEQRQNNVEELFSLLNFLEPEQFKSSAEFMAEFGNLQTESQVEKLKAVSDVQ